MRGPNSGESGYQESPVSILKKKIRPWMGTLLAISVAAAAAAATHGFWLPAVRSQLARWVAGETAPPQTTGAHAGHGHAHAGHDEDTSIELSASGLKNIGYRPVKVALGPFTKTVTLPGIVVERPGRSQLHVAAPLTGVVTRILATEGAAVAPQQVLFEVHLTHEELVAAQRDFIRTAKSLEVVNREVARLESVTDGVLAGKRILEQQYERDKLSAALQAERQALLLHGLKEDDLEAILREQKLFESVTVRAPRHDSDNEACRGDHLFHVQQLPVKVGQQVEIGQMLCVLADHCELYLKGQAFADDAVRLREAARHGWSVTARPLSGNGEAVEGLKLLYLADHVDADSRAFHCYLRLPNEVVLDRTSPAGQRFIQWRFNPGQRMEVRVPVERWENRIVLPAEAVVDEGAESYVYQQNGNHFVRTSVTVDYRDQQAAVLANDGSIFPGAIVAGRGAYQMHLALKNQAGGVDPHAGHSH
jgi:multidrug efflux pump subunit AcrA (membrane-fusion protein)